MHSKPPTIPVGVVACTLCDNLSRNSFIGYIVYIPANPQSTKIWRLEIFDNVWILSENHPKAFWMFPTSITACENRANFLPSIVQFDWLISDQLRYLLNIHQFDCSVLHFLIKNSSNKRTNSTSCFIFLFDISKITKLMKKFWKRPRYVFPGRFGALTGRLGDLMKNLETPGNTRRVGRYVYRYMLL